MGLLQSLPKGCQVVFNLHAIEGYKHKEIAEMLDISEGTSKSQYARAKLLLKDMISELGEVKHG
jgi:RNA polymerase sigma-70 factor (ECF subfamily)